MKKRKKERKKKAFMETNNGSNKFLIKQYICSKD